MLVVQGMYEQLCQPHMQLDWPPSLQGTLAEAIRHSLNTPGALLHRTLQVRLQLVQEKRRSSARDHVCPVCKICIPDDRGCLLVPIYHLQPHQASHSLRLRSLDRPSWQRVLLDSQTLFSHVTALCNDLSSIADGEASTAVQPGSHLQLKVLAPVQQHKD